MFKHLQTKFLALLAIMLMGGSYAWADDYTWTTANGQLSTSTTSVTINDVTWSFNPTWADDSKKYVSWAGGSQNKYQIGSSKNILNSLVLSTTGISGTITNVEVVWSSCAANNASLAVSVGGSSYSSTASTSSSSTLQTSDFTGQASGELVLAFTATTGVNFQKIVVTYTTDAPSTEPSIEVGSPTIEATADETDGTINVTYTNFSEVVAGVAFYDAEGTTTTYDWVTAEIDDNNNLYYLIEANEGAARTAYMKVYALDDDANLVYSELITISQAEYFEAINYTLASSITSGKHYIIASSNTDGGAQAMGAQGNNNRSGVDVTVSNNTIQTAEGVAEFVICGPDAEGNYTIYDAAEGGYLYAASSSSNHLKTQETLNDNGRWSISFGEDGEANIVAQGTNTRNTMRYNSGSSLFSCYSSGQGDVYLYEKADEAAPTQAVSISSAGLATFCSENALDFTGITDVWAYIAKNENGNVTYKRVQRVPARTGVLLRNKLETGAISCDVPTLEGTTKDDVSDNKFIGTLTDIDALASVVETNTNYILNNGDNGVGFYKAAGQKVGAGKAYLQLPTNAAKTFIGFDEEGEATAISTIDNGQLTMDNAYNLQGQKVGSEYKGIVIVNGKKFINK